MDGALGRCMICTGCKDCDTPSICKSCQTGLFLYQDKCISTCPDGFYPGNGKIILFFITKIKLVIFI